MICEGHVSCMGEMRNSYRLKFYSENLNGRDHLGDLGTDVKVISL
jgi:hypothetical protein